MKKLLLILIALTFIIISCKPKSRWDLIKEKQAYEISKGIINDTLCLGFAFGMSSDQVNNRFKLLVKEGKVIVNKDGKFEYNMLLDYIGNIKSTFSADYLNDSLYSLSLIIKADRVIDAELLQIKLATLYMDKLYYTFDVPSIIDKTKIDYLFLKGNQQIEIDYPSMDNVVVEYFDYNMHERKIKKKIEEENKRKQNTIKDL